MHFPIAFLSIYSIMELARWKKLNSKVYWFYVKAIIVIIGVGSSFFALQTGQIAKQKFRATPEMALVNMHSSWAILSVYIFSFVAILYIISWIDKELGIVKNESYRNIWHFALNIKTKVLESWIIIVLAALGLVAITITGALGGAIVYGPDTDPFIKAVYGVFF